jgi:hypothetical protein
VCRLEISILVPGAYSSRWEGDYSASPPVYTTFLSFTMTMYPYWTRSIDEELYVPSFALSPFSRLHTLGPIVWMKASLNNEDSNSWDLTVENSREHCV